MQSERNGVNGRKPEGSSEIRTTESSDNAVDGSEKNSPSNQLQLENNALDTKQQQHFEEILEENSDIPNISRDKPKTKATGKIKVAYIEDKRSRTVSVSSICLILD